MNRLHFTPLLSLLLALLFSLHAASCAADETDFYTEMPPLLRFTQQTQRETVTEDIHILRIYPDTANDRIDEEMRALIDVGDDVAIYCESYNDPHAYATIWYQGMNIDRDGQALDNESLIWDRYGETWRAWATHPTDEEREAAPWEEVG